MHRFSGTRNSGFTLFEILVSVTILVIGLCGIIAIFTASINWAQEVKADTIMGEGAKSVAAFCSARGYPSASGTIKTVQIPDENNTGDKPLNGFWYTIKRTTAKSARDVGLVNNDYNGNLDGVVVTAGGGRDLSATGASGGKSELCDLEIAGYLSKQDRDWSAANSDSTTRSVAIFHIRAVYYY